MLRKAFYSLNLTFLFIFSGSFLFVATSSVASAQEDEILDRLYGSGVHAYKRGDYKQAYHWLTEAMDSGNRDPRVRYFRGLAYLKLGRPDEASRDFDQAARREVMDGNLAKLVDQSLITVQGPDRYRIESARTNAHRERHLRNKSMIQERHAKPEQIRPGTPRNAEPEEGLMKDLPSPDDALLETDETSDKDRDNQQTSNAEEELFSTDDAKADPPVEPEKNETPDPFDDLFDEETEDKTEKNPPVDEDSDDDIFGE